MLYGVAHIHGAHDFSFSLISFAGPIATYDFNGSFVLSSVGISF